MKRTVIVTLTVLIALCFTACQMEKMAELQPPAQKGKRAVASTPPLTPPPPPPPPAATMARRDCSKCRVQGVEGGVMGGVATPVSGCGSVSRGEVADVPAEVSTGAGALSYEACSRGVQASTPSNNARVSRLGTFAVINMCLPCLSLSLQRSTPGAQDGVLHQCAPSRRRRSPRWWASPSRAGTRRAFPWQAVPRRRSGQKAPWC